MAKSFEERIADMRQRLDSDSAYRDPSLLAFMMRDWPETKAANLFSVAWELARGEYGCHRNDVIWLLDKIEECGR